MYFAIIVAVAVFDQILKYIVKAGVEPHTSIPVFGDFLTITLHFNTGAAFSMMEGYRVLLSVVPLVFIIAIIVYIFVKRKTDHPLLLTSLSLIAGGGIGNLIDRFMFGKVTDFISVGSFPIFNLADMFVVTGCGLVIVYLIFFDKEKDVKKEIKK